jgi:hypothetical protein
MGDMMSTPTSRSHPTVPGHSHGASAPHPAQPPSWSILRMTLPARLGVVLLLSGVLWTIVLTAMR